MVMLLSQTLDRRVRPRTSATSRPTATTSTAAALHSYAAAVTLPALAGIFNIAFTSTAQALVQILAPPRLRGRVVGLFNTSMLGLRAGSGVTVGALGAALGVEWSSALGRAGRSPSPCTRPGSACMRRRP